MATAAASAQAGRPAAPSAGKEKFLVIPIIILILAQMGATGDSGALSLSATALTEDLKATTSDIQLANMIYPLVGGAFMIAGGLMGTIIGWKRTFRIGILLCAAGEVVLAFAPNMIVFIWVGRVLVGFGASFMIPSVLGLIPQLYRGSNRMVAFGCIGAASGLSALLPLALGVILEAAGMKATFLALAAYFLVVFAASFLLPPIDQTDEKLKFDGAGVALAASGLFLFLIGISSISSWGLIEPLASCPFTVFGISPALPMAGVGIVVLAALIPVEKRVEEKNGVALLPQSFLKTPQVLAGLVANAVMFFFMGAQSILMAPYLQLVSGWSPIDVGTISIVTGVPTFALALGIPKLMPKANPRHVIQFGYVAMASALIIMASSVTEIGSKTPAVYLGAFMAGVGAGAVSSHASNVVALALPERDASQSGGIQSTMRNVGQALGVALLGAILLLGITNSVRTHAIDDPSISSQVSSEIATLNIDLTSNEVFEEQISGISMTDDEKTALVDIEEQARYNSVRLAYTAGAVIVLLGLFTTPAIKTLSREAEKDEGHSEKDSDDRS